MLALVSRMLDKAATIAARFHPSRLKHVRPFFPPFVYADTL